MERKKIAIIVAAGSGSRMKSKLPKQFVEINGKPILRHTIEKFLSLSFPVEIIVVLSDEYKDYWKQYCRDNDFLKRYSMPSGGITRFHSVKNALNYVPNNSIVAIHDGVRPFVNADFLELLFSQAEACGAVAPVVPIVESIREISPQGSIPVDRSKFLAVQTPQVFKSEIIKSAYSQTYKTSFTDDITVVQEASYPITTIEGLRYNFKITTPEDMIIAKALLS